MLTAADATIDSATHDTSAVTNDYKGPATFINVASNVDFATGETTKMVTIITYFTRPTTTIFYCYK